MAAVGIHAVRKSFGDVRVLNAVDLDIEDGEFMTLVGPSGCGKSTLLRIIAGLEIQDAGSIAIDGAAIDDLRPSDRNLAMVFQSYALYPHLTVAQNIAVPLKMRSMNALERLPLVGRLSPSAGSKSADIDRRVQQVAKQLDIAHLLDRKPKQLSGGQRQRVAVGRAMVRQPNVFLMDEPLSNLDAKLRVHMRTEIADLHRTLGTTFIYVTHDQAEAMTMSTRIAVMMEGDLLQVAPPDEVYDNPSDVRVAEFIGSPKINIFPATADADGTVDCQGVPISLSVDATPGTALKIGIRPEKLAITGTGPGRLNGEIRHIENLGPDLLIHLRQGANDGIIARVPTASGHGHRVGEKVGLVFGLDDVLAFSADSGARLTARTARDAREQRHA